MIADFGHSDARPAEARLSGSVSSAALRYVMICGRFGLAVGGVDHRTERVLRLDGCGSAASARRRRSRCAASASACSRRALRRPASGSWSAAQRTSSRRARRWCAARSRAGCPAGNTNAPPGAKDRQDVSRGAMRQRRVDQIPVARRETVGVALGDDAGVPAAIGLHHAFRHAGRAAGELDRDRGVERHIGRPVKRTSALAARPNTVSAGAPSSRWIDGSAAVDARRHGFDRAAAQPVW